MKELLKIFVRQNYYSSQIEHNLSKEYINIDDEECVGGHND